MPTVLRRQKAPKDISSDINCFWEHLVCAMFLYPESDTAFLYIGDNLKIKLTRGFDGENIRYDGLLMKNIPVLGEDDWRVATSLVEEPSFGCIGETDLFDAIIALLEQINERKVSFYILSPDDKKVLVAMEFIELA